jgi:preprotein translocase subunit SecE
LRVALGVVDVREMLRIVWVAASDNVKMSAMIEEFWRIGVYKRSQGRIVRQVTFAAIAGALLIGLYQLVTWLRLKEGISPWVCYGMPTVLAVAGLWATYRIVNLPAFADFLIAVEAEMNKVSWPSWTELVRWSLVVIVMIFAIGFLLAAFDGFWVWIFQLIGLLPKVTKG